MLATSVMKDGENTRLGKTNVENLLSEFNMEMNANRVIIWLLITYKVFSHRIVLVLLACFSGPESIHAKQRSSTGSTPQSTSVPSLGHNDSVICSMRQIEGSNVSIKLTLGTHSFNALGAASTRIDNLVDHPECGP
ncbi:uncharacterized protein EV154DRAFT_478142 [Mucor mucedo]|uniref:uncharacterized protein n=1 Tax=Mucor mucedo TaxID=29922 RepID=UPI00222121AB|nr:uncharacterized protein EV154DRAFT_478142 [Mucor mucedo]KAI7894746.1 hypothetical protein EV154DRAFT_478142 [Mucor mucedo]